MISRSDIRAEAERHRQIFVDAGARHVEAPHLLDAETLLDLYGEDIRARAFTTYDPDHGERMLRPDFTVPVVEQHMASGAEPARYCYLGEVFRMQPAGSRRPSEYLQVGYEVFDRSNPHRADAEVLSLMLKALDGVATETTFGDIGLLFAAIDSLDTIEARKVALRRHVWRPWRFRALLDRYSAPAAQTGSRARFLQAAEEKGLAALIAQAGPTIGLRSTDEVSARLERMREDALEPPIDAGQADALRQLLALKCPAAFATTQLLNFAVDLPQLQAAVETFEARNKALSEVGLELEELAFEATYGRSQMEYYDGFVFGISAAQGGLPPLATGGRYDALTRQLGQGREIPAVGGVIRTEIVAKAKGSAS